MTDVEIIPYIPQTIVRPRRLLEGDFGTSSWIGLESILADLLQRFQVGRSLAVEFGAEHGYSAVALSNYFRLVRTVDPFGQMTATPPIEPMEERCRRNIAPWPNIQLLVEPWQMFCARTRMACDLVHVDAEHNYADTFGIGDWACQHAPVTIFHDTESFPGTVKPAVRDLAAKWGLEFHNFDRYHGLGILVRKGVVQR